MHDGLGILEELAAIEAPQLSTLEAPAQEQEGTDLAKELWVVWVSCKSWADPGQLRQVMPTTTAKTAAAPSIPNLPS